MGDELGTLDSVVYFGVIAVLLMLIVFGLEHGSFWRWHRYWYLHTLKNSVDLRRWEKRYARLSIVKRSRNTSPVEVFTNGERRDLIEVLRQRLLKHHNDSYRVFVLGSPGSGKTTSLERLVYELAHDATRRLGFTLPMPVLIRLGLATKSEPVSLIAEALGNAVKGRSGEVLEHRAERLLAEGHLLVCFDALDEVSGKLREDMLSELQKFLKSERYSSVPIVISVRSRQDPSGRFVSLPVLEIQDLSDKAVKALIRAYESEEDTEREIWERLDKQNLLGEGELGRNPYWLQLMLESKVFHGSKGQILDEAVDRLLQRELREKPDMGRLYSQIPDAEIQARLTKDALAALAEEMSHQHLRSIFENDALSILTAVLENRWKNIPIKAHDVLGLARDAQLISYRSEFLYFSHRLVQEFLSAWSLKEREKELTSIYLKSLIQDSDWWETLLMLGSLVQDQNQFACNVLGDGLDVQQCFLAVTLIKVTGEHDSLTVKRVTDFFADSLGTGLTPEHKEAAKVLINIAEPAVFDALDRVARDKKKINGQAILVYMGELGAGSQYAAELVIQHLSDNLFRNSAIEALIHIGSKAIDPLVTVLEEENPWVRRAAIEALGKIGGVGVVALLVELLNDSDVRRAAIEALGQTGDSSAVAPVVESLRDPDLRIVAIEALCRIGDPAVAFLIEAIKDFNVRRVAVGALGQIGDYAVAPLIEALREENPWVRMAAVEALGQTGNSSAVAPLVEALRDEEPSIRSTAIKSLGEIGDARSVATLIKALGDGNMRMTAIKALGQTGDVSAVAPLVEALTHENLRRSAIEALGEIGDAGAVAPLVETLRDEDCWVREAASMALGKIGDPSAVAPLAEALRDEDSRVRRAATEALGEIGDARAVVPLVEALRVLDIQKVASKALGRIGDAAFAPLVEALSDDREWVLKAVIEALGETGDARAVAPLVELLRNKYSLVRSAVIKALGEIGDARAVAPLVEVLRDEDSWERGAAIKALGNIGDIGAFAPLVEAIRDENSAVSRAAIEALGKIGDARMVAPLIEGIRDEDPRVRRATIEVLGEIGDARAVAPLVEALRDFDLRRVAIEALVRIGEAAYAPLNEALKDENPWVREAAIEARNRLIE